MNKMERGLSKYLKPDELKKIRSKKIGIAGCGGLGSNAANNLVRLGFKDFILVDFDIVEETNLNRQFYFFDQIGNVKCEALHKNLLRINPEVNIETINIKINKKNIHSIFEGCDYIIEGFDKVKYKTLLIEELSPYIPCISASGLGSYWYVDDITTMEVNKNLMIVGDFISDVDNGVSPLSPGVAIGAAKGSAALLKMVLGGECD